MYGETEREIAQLKTQRAKLERNLMDEHKQRALLESDYNAVKDLIQETELSKKTIGEQRDQLRKEVDRLKDIKLTTMDEKVARIVDILDRQTILLESIQEILRKGGAQFGAKPLR